MFSSKNRCATGSRGGYLHVFASIQLVFEAFRACEDSVQNISCVDFEVYVGANVDSDTKLIQYEGMDLKACRAEGFEVPSRGLYT